MRGMFDQYIEASDGFVLVYSIEDRASFELAESLLLKVQEKKQEGFFRVVLVGNKLDSTHREVSDKAGHRLAARFGIKLFETSCSTGENVLTTFQYLVRRNLTEAKIASR